jgi:hypothetical protein
MIIVWKRRQRLPCVPNHPLIVENHAIQNKADKTIFLYPTQSLNILPVSKYLAIVIDLFLFTCFFSSFSLVSSWSLFLFHYLLAFVEIFADVWLIYFIDHDYHDLFLFFLSIFFLFTVFYFIPIPLFFEIFTLYCDLFVFSTVTIMFCCLLSIVIFYQSIIYWFLLTDSSVSLVIYLFFHSFTLILLRMRYFL